MATAIARQANTASNRANSRISRSANEELDSKILAMRRRFFASFQFDACTNECGIAVYKWIGSSLIIYNPHGRVLSWYLSGIIGCSRRLSINVIMRIAA